MTGLNLLFETLKINENEVKLTEFSSLRILEEMESIIQDAKMDSLSREFYLEFLKVTRRSDFLLSLKSDENRNRWSNIVFYILQHTNYSLLDMMIQRVEEHPNKILFKDMSSTTPIDWSYEQIFRHLKEIATVFYLSVKEAPRVALFTDNCLEGACCDLASLCFDIFITPLSIHFSQEILIHIFDSLQINIALADSKERLSLLQKVQNKTKSTFVIYSLLPSSHKSGEINYLHEECKKLVSNDIDTILEKHTIRKNNEVATTMFTSGSTGLPKGVSFSIYNIVSKRFARAAALPEVGEETFLCYLPLFHTFGRYLEMTGAIFWSGTYIFAGNTSAETLLSLFPHVNPTGFISIPLRWQELFEKCQEKIDKIENLELREEAIREIVGSRLKWGLSAAGYLDPKVFRFFNQYGIHLCSGFGMTEATGGITMTPPGIYKDFTVGIPLPGVKTRLNDNSELEISGHYIGKYLEDAPPESIIPYPEGLEKDHWFSTGDVFTVSNEGYYQIIDRVKDIYKNNRGQTVAPQVLEKKFFKVPGIKRTFLVGDNRPYNVLLIVPDKNDPIFHSLTGENVEEYFHQIVMSANNDVAPYERVVNYTLLERDFSSDSGELTPKGSFNRKIIENNFKDVIEALYKSNIVSIATGEFTILIPRWFFRDLGILENDIQFQDNQLINRRGSKLLSIVKTDQISYRIGDLIYKIHSDTIDLGLFARQPKLWIGNPELINFCPVKEGWDASIGNISPMVYFSNEKKYLENELPQIKTRNPLLVQVNDLVIKAFFLDFQIAYQAIQEAGRLFDETEPRVAILLRYRLEALAYHPEEEIRTLSYRILLLQAPDPGQIHSMPTFIESGLSFLNEKSIKEIASSNFGKHRLDALKQRLYNYRTHLTWPAEKKNQEQFESVLRMLYNFAVLHLEFYVSVRAELSRWILHKKDPYLSSRAEEYFNQLAGYFEKTIDERIPKYPLEVWYSKLVFEYGISDQEKEWIAGIFHYTTFFQESVILAFNEHNFDLTDVPDNGIWILRLHAHKEFKHYRLSVNTMSGKHFDLHLVMSENPDFRPNPNTFYWLASLAGFPFGPSVAPLLGSSRPSLGILSTQYIGGLTAWDKIRELSEPHKSSGFMKTNIWKKTFITSLSVLFKAWHHSGYQIIPGVISPANVVVPELDFRESARILSLTGWSPYKNSLSLIGPMIQDFYCKTTALYPWCKNQLDINWIFEACIEALGLSEAEKFFQTLQNDLKERSIYYYNNKNFSDDLENYLGNNLKKYYLPLSLMNAIDQYTDWFKMNPLTTYSAKEQTLVELMELYKLDTQSDLIRYYFYRYSYFEDSSKDIKDAYNKLLEKILEHPEVLPIQLIELSELQYSIIDPEDKNVFSRMVFPRLKNEQKIDFLKVGEKINEHVIVRFNLQDKTGTRYTQREPIEPREIGQLYQLFFRENYPKEISDSDHHFVVADDNGKIIGGLTWRFLENNNILLDGIVVTSSLQGKGIASAMIENFFTTMAARGVNIIKAHFLFGNYYMKHYFKVDKKWGALVKTLNES